MIITLHWQHFILIIGFVIPIFAVWVPYSKSGSDNYGIGAMMAGTATLIVWLLFLVVYFGLYYFGAFK